MAPTSGKGQLLAIIASPEVDKQLLQARADLTTAEANAGLAKTNSTRYQGLLNQNAVSKQDADNFITQAASTSSTVNSAQANVQRLEELQSFEKIYAPFSGVITARGVDVGQLINAGSGTEMFRISSLDVLRVYVNVPQIYSQAAVPGTIAQLTLSEFPGQIFTGKLVRNARAIDPASRTLLVEIDVANRDGKLMPGAYAQVHMAVHTAVVPMIIPVSALIFRSEGLQVSTMVKGPNGDQAKLVHVVLGQDDGSTVQVVNGLDTDSQVIQNPPDSLIDGEPVHVVQAGKSGAEEEQHPSNGSGVLMRSQRGWIGSLLVLLTGCTVGPNYHRPTAPTAPAFKESAVLPPPDLPGGGWKQVSPNDSAMRTNWWEIYQDPPTGQARTAGCRFQPEAEGLL